MNVEIKHKLNTLCTGTSSDFVAFAQVNERNHAIHWNYVVGNLNQRYKHMVGKSGKGLSGTVLRFGRIIIVDQNTPNYEKTRLEYPIMLAENLYSAIAVPVYFKEKIGGILLVASRSLRAYTPNQINDITTAAEDFASLYYNEKP